jgi:hypothetical protein
MSTAIYENIERELEMAAEALEADPNGEAEAPSKKLWRYWDALISVGGAPWQTMEKIGPLEDTRENAIRIRGTLWAKWYPAAQERRGTLLVRCLTWSPVSKAWMDCQTFSG